MFGISTSQWKIIFRIFQEYQNGIQWIKLFGSRARGDAKKTSDVDLAVLGTEGAIRKLAIALEDSNVPYTFDVIDYERQVNENLQKAIDQEGKMLFATVGGKYSMTIAQLQMKWEDYHKAMKRLRIAANSQADADGLYLDATIQRFEFCFELAWKLMKAMLDYEGIEASSPRSSIREGWKQAMIDSAEDWLQMQEQRNLSSHTYNESTAQDIYEKICSKYIDLLTAFEQEAAGRINPNS